MAPPVGMAIFGIGRAGRIHLHNVMRNHRIILKYVVDIQVEAVQKIIDEYRLSETTVLHPDDSQTVYSDESVGAVIVCTPTHTHEPIVSAALRHGKGVFCEKPIANDLESTAACYDEAAKAGKPLLCSFNRRFDPGLMKVHASVKAGELGTIHTIKTCARDHPLPPIEYLRISGGIFHDCAVHDIDLVCWLLGEYPVTVYSQAHAHVPMIQEMDDVDTVLIMMTFASGVITTIDLSRNSNYGYDQRCEVFGSGGMLQSENQQPTAVVQSNKSGVHSDPLKWSFPQRYAESYVQAIEHFLDVLQGDAELDITKEATLMNCRIAAACEESSRTGKPITILKASDYVNGVEK